MGEILVLGGGMVGVGAALALQARGHEIILVDRQPPGLETSYGNAGVIQAEAVEPYAIPRDLATLWSYATGHSNDIRWHPRALPAMLPALWRYFRASAPAAHRIASQSYAKLIARATADHAPLIAASGSEGLIRRTGMGEIHCTARALEAAQSYAARIKAEYGIPYEILTGAALRQAEPALTGEIAGMLLWTEPWSSRDPGALTRAYADLFVARGGQIVEADALTLAPKAGGWALAGGIEAEQAVIALGPWSPDLLSRLGRRLPMVWKRGYHGHYTAPVPLERPCLDAGNGVVLSSMTRGLRITTGAELTSRTAARDLTQLTHGRRAAGELMALGEAVPDSVWHGHRPCLPRMLPMIGQVQGHKGLWLDTGHGHQGFTLGPTSGEILAQIMDGRADALATALAPSFA